MTEPYPYGTSITIKPDCQRHELKSAFVLSEGQTAGDGEYRYHCLFPFGKQYRWARVYSSEIESADADGVSLEQWRAFFCAGCGQATEDGCAQNSTPWTCA